jgi:FtsP/CotA-like multicopper oxidase with cupredoxin domain
MSAAATATQTAVPFTVGRAGFLTPVVPYVMHCHNIEHEDHEMMMRWGVLR